jgi:hypothetical protein
MGKFGTPLGNISQMEQTFRLMVTAFVTAQPRLAA